MSSNEEVDAIVANGGNCAICQCTLIGNKSTKNIQQHINGRKHVLRQKQLQFSAPLKTWVDKKAATSNFVWEDNFDENLLKKDGIIITGSGIDRESAECAHCLCDLPPLSISKDANVYNTKVHVIGEKHTINSSLSAMGRNQQNLKVNKKYKEKVNNPHDLVPLFNSALNLQNNLVGKPLSVTNVDYVFDILEETVKRINFIQESGFSKFYVNRKYITYSAKRMYSCLLCKIDFPITRNGNASYNVAVHISGHKHLNSFKTFDQDGGVETKTLLHLHGKATQKILLQLIMNKDEAVALKIYPISPQS